MPPYFLLCLSSLEKIKDNSLYQQMTDQQSSTSPFTCPHPSPNYWGHFHSLGVTSRHLSYPTPTLRGTGVVCTSSIPKRTLLMACPYHLVLNKTTILAQREGRYSERHHIFSLMTSDYVYLIDEVVKSRMGKREEWFSSTVNTLMDFGEGRVMATENDALIEEYRHQNETLNQSFMAYWTMISEENGGDQPFQKEEYYAAYRQAYQFVSTRAFDYNMPELGLIPVFECLNHSEEARNMTRLALVNVNFENNPSLFEEWFEEMSFRFPQKRIASYQFLEGKVDIKIAEPLVEARTPFQFSQVLGHPCYDVLFPITHVVIYSLRDILKDEELLLDYGEKTNLQLLANYGFCEQDNLHDTLKFYLLSDQAERDASYPEDKTNPTSFEITGSLSNFMDFLNLAKRTLSSQSLRPPELSPSEVSLEQQKFTLQHLQGRFNNKMREYVFPPEQEYEDIHIDRYLRGQYRICESAVRCIQSLKLLNEQCRKGGFPVDEYQQRSKGCMDDCRVSYTL